LLFPHLDIFTTSLQQLQNDSAIRPIAKICSWIANDLNNQDKKTLKEKITKQQIDAIVTTSFDWLIGDYKVATKVYSMETLFLLGSLPNATSWIHVTLQQIIAENMFSSSKAYQSRGKKILHQLQKK